MLVYALVAKQNARFKDELIELWRDKKVLLRMLLASFLIAANWLIYIYAVGHGQATQASLAITLCLLFLLLFALIFLRESLSRTMWAAVVLAFYRSTGSCCQYRKTSHGFFGIGPDLWFLWFNQKRG